MGLVSIQRRLLFQEIIMVAMQVGLLLRKHYFSTKQGYNSYMSVQCRLSEFLVIFIVLKYL